MQKAKNVFVILIKCRPLLKSKVLNTPDINIYARGKNNLELQKSLRIVYLFLDELGYQTLSLVPT